ncbi:hypothetical protein [Planosporangium mesophilum]|uniref:Uncharacterized protein n=1 Tax=Planosporangium mesophilum TaxID=689768 RepID=A0A8J3WZX1_9ACTN|nr:hypothetical protein [Planosporangium mesophilum]NJC83976.1 hypothetical protein [Planosporangium mesophilum]GII22657.1 hypothetical protein Pme01_22540 [Planosporangium mesophilum]
MSETPRFEPVTEEERERARQAMEQLERDLEEAAKRPRPPVHSPGKFTESLGLDAHGNLQPPLTPEEAAHNEMIRRRARGEHPGGVEPADTRPADDDHG